MRVGADRPGERAVQKQKPKLILVLDHKSKASRFTVAVNQDRDGLASGLVRFLARSTAFNFSRMAASATLTLNFFEYCVRVLFWGWNSSFAKAWQLIRNLA